jgi:hypothetical protein
LHDQYVKDILDASNRYQNYLKNEFIFNKSTHDEEYKSTDDKQHEINHDEEHKLTVDKQQRINLNKELPDLPDTIESEKDTSKEDYKDDLFFDMMSSTKEGRKRAINMINVLLESLEMEIDKDPMEPERDPKEGLKLRDDTKKHPY